MNSPHGTAGVSRGLATPVFFFMVMRDVLASSEVFNFGFVIHFCFLDLYDVWVLFPLRFSAGFFLLTQDSLISL